jgi:sterol desaturase/sphingolipid hydroxylase (fatty acid hydroxylase superfamily)
MCIKGEPKTTVAKVVPNTKKEKAIAPTHSSYDRDTSYDFLLFMVPALFWKITPVLPLYAIGILRILSTRLTVALHYLFVDKDNYNHKVSQKQLMREKKDYLVGCVLHMWVQVVLQIIFPSMFFSDPSKIWTCAVKTFWCHILFVEPLYYFAHRWLHIPRQMKAMHGFHHLSIHPTPSTSLVQNFEEHFIYIATFGPAFFLPFFTGGDQHWIVIGAYLIIFDAINAWGHTNVKIRHWAFTSKYSPLHYLFYTPEFHLGHHFYFSANFSLFMPIWDYLFGTHRQYIKPADNLLPPKQQDVVFIGHNGGLGHLMTCPEWSIYNIYDSYIRTFLPISLEFFVMHIICIISRIFLSSYSCSRFLVKQRYIGRVICIVRSPWDYMSPKKYDAINQDILRLMKDQHKACNTRCFGLGNLNKMKQLNDGGVDIVEMVKKDSYLKDKNIRVWTGDTMTTASVYHQIADIPDLNELFFIGANGKVGTAVCQLLLRSRPNMKIRIYSRYHAMNHPNISYTSDLGEIVQYKVVVVGKFYTGHKYAQAFRGSEDHYRTRLILDYTVPFFPIAIKQCPLIRHIQIGLLRMTDTSPSAFLKGHFDVCMSHDENHIYPCHAGCLLNLAEGRETDETGDINLNDVDVIWNKALKFGLQNRAIP